jgi:hypothetical protein
VRRDFGENIGGVEANHGIEFDWSSFLFFPAANYQRELRPAIFVGVVKVK